MIAAVDVDYREDGAGVACVGFEDWADAAPRFEVAFRSRTPPADYAPGSFYLRELPYLLEVLAAVPAAVDIIVVDGFVWLGPEAPGLGARLWQALEQKVAVVGVAKSPYRGGIGLPVERGHSARPLYVTAAGLPPEEAAHGLGAMQGIHRLPTLLKRVDQLARRA